MLIEWPGYFFNKTFITGQHEHAVQSCHVSQFIFPFQFIFIIATSESFKHCIPPLRKHQGQSFALIACHDRKTLKRHLDSIASEQWNATIPLVVPYGRQHSIRIKNNWRHVSLRFQAMQLQEIQMYKIQYIPQSE